MTKAADGYDAEKALQIVELIAEGHTLAEVARRADLPSKATIYRWLSLHTKFFDAYERAKELSAQSLEDEALEMARILREPNDFTGTKVQAFNVAMQQLRWSAAHRDKSRYGSQTTVSTVVPIQIVSTLNLGQEGSGPALDNEQSVYTIEAMVPVREEEPERDVDEVDTPDTSDEVDTPPTRLDLQALPGENDTLSEGRVKKRPAKHKSPAAAARSARIYAQREIKRAKG